MKDGVQLSAKPSRSATFDGSAGTSAPRNESRREPDLRLQVKGRLVDTARPKCKLDLEREAR